MDSRQTPLPYSRKLSVPSGEFSDGLSNGAPSGDLTGLVNNGEIINKEPETKKKEDFSFFKAPRRKKFLLLCMGFVNFCAMTCFSLLAPFFPKEAEAKGASQTVVGMVFGCFELVIFITAPIYGNYITKIGAKFMFISGVLVCGTCAILFGLLDKSPDGDIFIVMCFLCRTVEALGCSAFVTSSFAIVSYEFPDHVATVIGSLETFSGIGLMVGPTVGSALYVAGGYGLPFFVMGGVLIVCAVVCSNIMPKIDDRESPSSKNVLSLLKSPLCVATGVCIICGAFSLGFLDPNLALHLSKLNLSQIAIGLMFLISPGMYALTAPLWGWIGDSKGVAKALVVGGNLFTIIAFLMMGPSPLIPFYPYTIWSIVLALLTMGVFLGCALIPTFRTMFEGAQLLGMEENFETFGMVSGTFNSCFSLGAFLGPTVGGALVDKYGFAVASSICSVLFLFSALLMFGYCVMAKYSNCVPSAPTQSGFRYNTFQDENIPLHEMSKESDEASP